MSFSNYKASDGEDRGQVICWATNDLGESTKPCIFHVVPLGIPHPPTKCEVKIFMFLSEIFVVTCKGLFLSRIQNNPSLVL